MNLKCKIILVLVVCFALLISSCSNNKATDPTDPTPTSISINPENVFLEIGETQQLTITVSPDNANPSVTWSSDNQDIATVSPSGEVTAVAQGQAIITAISDVAPNVTASRTIYVSLEPPTAISINPDIVTLDIGQTQQLTITTTPENANPSVSWTSSNPSVATITTGGEVTAISAGQATISVASILVPSVTATRLINVNADPTATVTISLSTIDGGSVIGADVELQNHAGNTYSETAHSSNVTFPDLPYGTYSLTVSHAGYQLYNLDTLSIQSTTVTLTVQLTPSTISIGDIIPFGAHQWRVLALQGSRALIISENVLELEAYHEIGVTVTWEDCTLRQYLNETFYNTFSEANKSRITEVMNINIDNQLYGTNGGNNTQDKIFLLSLAEVVQYFGDSGQLGTNNVISDEYNSNRIATYNGSAVWWWLRSPGFYSHNASSVDFAGHIRLDGRVVSHASNGVRPALWLNL